MHISFLILTVVVVIFVFCCFLCPDVSADHFTHSHPTALLLAFLRHHVQARFSFHPLFRAVISPSHPFVSRPFVLLFCSYVDVVLVFRSCRITGGAPLRKTGTAAPRVDSGLRSPERFADQSHRNFKLQRRSAFILFRNAKSNFIYITFVDYCCHWGSYRFHYFFFTFAVTTCVIEARVQTHSAARFNTWFPRIPAATLRRVWLVPEVSECTTGKHFIHFDFRNLGFL